MEETSLYYVCLRTVIRTMYRLRATSDIIIVFYRGETERSN